MTAVKKTGILGGTFNPVHIGHLRLATAVVEALHLDEVELMPCAVPPHKPESGLLPFELRASLLQAALEGSRGTAPLRVSLLEGELSAPSYTWNLLTAWRERHRDAAPLFILGGEDFAQMDTWYRGLELPKLTNLVVVPRAGMREQSFLDTLARFWPDAVPATTGGTLSATMPGGASFFFLPLPYLDISASIVRTKWMQGENIRYLTPDPVIDLLDSYRDEIRRSWLC
ncbi:MAG: nicotinate (nicotinamide) nucleotide adenylyltransferase [Bilophila sp.]